MADLVPKGLSGVENLENLGGKRDGVMVRAQAAPLEKAGLMPSAQMATHNRL